jgi:hypothetical protein
MSDLWCALLLIIPPAAVYCQNIISEGTVRQSCRMFKDGRKNIHDEERSGRPSVVSDDLVRSVDQKICERRRFTISELLCEFPHISRTVLYEIIIDRLGYHRFCARWVQQWGGVDGKCQNVAELSGGRLLWHRHTKLIPRYDKCLNSGGDYVEK